MSQIISSKKEQIVRLLKEKQTQLEQSLQREKVYLQELSFYKSKLQQQIEENQKSIKTFARVTQLAITAVQIFNKIDGLPLIESVKSEKNQVIMKFIRASTQSENADLMASISQDNNNEMDNSQMNYIEEIIDETINIMEYIVQMTVSFQRSVQMIRVEAEKVKQDKLWLKDLNKQIEEKTLENTIIKKILKNLQSEKLQILHDIDKVLGLDDLSTIQKLNKEQLIKLVKKLAFRVNQLEREKNADFKKQRLNQKEEIQKYQDILQQLRNYKKKQKSMPVNFSLKL